MPVYYSKYCKLRIDNGLVEDLRHQCDGLQDIRVLQHLCTRVTATEGKTYFVDEKEVMEKRLRDALVD